MCVLNLYETEVNRNLIFVKIQFMHLEKRSNNHIKYLLLFFYMDEEFMKKITLYMGNKMSKKS